MHEKSTDTRPAVLPPQAAPPARQVLARVYADRDVADVESYVKSAVDGSGLALAGAEHDRLVVQGIILMRRVARALPPEVSLAEVLRDRLLPALLSYHHHRSTVEAAPPAGPRPVAAHRAA